MDYDTDFEEGFGYTSLGAIHFMHHPGLDEKLIFLHGLGGDVRVWLKLLRYLPEDLDIFLLDLLGHGKSDAPKMDYTISAQFQALREFMALQNNGDSYIFGHSYGGWIAAYYASQPYTCKGIILEDAAGLKEQFDQIKNVNDYKERLTRATLAVNNNKEYVIRSILDQDFSGEDQLTQKTLSTIKSPSLVIWGSNDNVISKDFAYTFTKEIKNSQLRIIDGAGHEAHYTHPKDVSELLLKFIGY